MDGRLQELLSPFRQLVGTKFLHKFAYAISCRIETWIVLKLIIRIIIILNN